MFGKIKLVIISLLLVFSVQFSYANVYKNYSYFNILTETVIENETKTINDSILLSLLEKYNVHHPEIVLAQAKLETGNYKSILCKNHFNLFGIKLNGKYAHFKNFDESVIAYRDKIQYKYRSGEDYYHFLTRIRYATASGYVSKVKHIVNQIK